MVFVFYKFPVTHYNNSISLFTYVKYDGERNLIYENNYCGLSEDRLSP